MLSAPIRILCQWLLLAIALIEIPCISKAQSFINGSTATFTDTAKFSANSVTSSMTLNSLTNSTAVNNIDLFAPGDDSALASQPVAIPPPPPGNDLCSSPTLITSGITCSATTGTMANATVSSTGSCSGTVKYDVWYSFVAQSTSPSIILKNIGSNFTSPGLEFYSACGGSSMFCGTVVNAGGVISGSLVASGLTIGSTYLIRVYSTQAAAVPTTNANFDICITDPTPTVTSRTNEVFLQTTLSGSGILNDPWEVTYGLNDSLWVTEAKGYKVYLIDPKTGNKTTVLDISNGASGGGLTNAEHTTFNCQFSPNGSNQVTACGCWPQGGLAGLAVHPSFTTDPTKRFVYISYVHHWVSGTSSSSTGIFFLNYLVRFTYDPVSQQLTTPKVICDTLPGSSDHNSQRLIIAPAKGIAYYGTKNYLFYAEGDMGAGQFQNLTRIEKAQFSNSYEGKILRFNLEEDLDAVASDKWIPNDNPFNIPAPPAVPTTQSAVWVKGIRNNQGFGYARINNTDFLYGSSHGPYSDDEINIIDSSKNYGHPSVIGYNDGNYNGFSAGYSGSSMPTITSESANATAMGNYQDPIFAAYDATNTKISTIWNTNANATWPSEAWSGMEVYTNSVIPGWKNSLVLGGLKWGRVIRLKLSANGKTIAPTPYTSAATRPVDDTVIYFESTNRFRDIAFAPNGRDMYVIMDKSATTSGPSAANPKVPGCAGCLQKFTFLGYNNNVVDGRSTIPTYTTISIPVATDSCITTSTATINSANKNNNLWVPFTGPDGNIVAEVNAKGNNLDTVKASFYEHLGPLRQDASKKLFSNRSFTITPKTQPVSPVVVRLYISKGDLDSMIGKTNSNGVASGVNVITDLAVFKNSDVCGTPITSAGTWIIPTYAEAFDTGYVLQFSISSFSSFFLAGKSMIILPLELLTFEGSMQKNAANLLWKTTNERNTDYFNVERSTDGRSFSQIGRVKALGNTNNENNYTYVDNDACNQLSPIIYYRLKMVDATGSYSYSQVIQLQCVPSGLIVDVYPNPIHHKLNVRISMQKAENVQVQVTDMQGRIVYSQSRFVSAGTSEINLDTQRWPAQVYSVKVATNDSKVLIIKNVVKQ